MIYCYKLSLLQKYRHQLKPRKKSKISKKTDGEEDYINTADESGSANDGSVLGLCGMGMESANSVCHQYASSDVLEPNMLLLGWYSANNKMDKTYFALYRYNGTVRLSLIGPFISHVVLSLCLYSVSFV